MAARLLIQQQCTRSLLPTQHLPASPFLSNSLICKEKGSGTPFAYIEHAANHSQLSKQRS